MSYQKAKDVSDDLKVESDLDPGPTLWSHVCKFGPFDCEYIPDISEYYCSSMPMHFGMQIFVSIVTGMCILNFYINDCPSISSLPLRYISLVAVAVFGSLFFWSYFYASYSDPGFLPYNWRNSRKTWYSPEELLSGTATTEEQISFARSSPRPKLASFSRSFGRFVLRADHVCGWIGNWVGKRNYKHFCLMNLYGSLLSACTLLVGLIANRITANTRTDWTISLRVFAITFEFFFTIVCGGMFFSSLYSICKNTTGIMELKGERPEEGSCAQNFEQVCGRTSMACYLCPTSAFGEEIEFTAVSPNPDDLEE